MATLAMVINGLIIQFVTYGNPYIYVLLYLYIYRYSNTVKMDFATRETDTPIPKKIFHVIT